MSNSAVVKAIAMGHGARVERCGLSKPILFSRDDKPAFETSK